MVLENGVQVLFAWITFAIVFVSVIFNSLEKHLPIWVSRTLRYGKLSGNKENDLFTRVEVPRSWFRHFYIYSSCLTVSTLWVAVDVYLFEAKPPDWVLSLLDAVGGRNILHRVTSTHSLLALILMTLQCLRRFRDTCFVSVFGANGRMHIILYFLGFIHYTGAVLAIMLEAPIFSPSVSKSPVQLSDLNHWDYAATALFLWAWYHQGLVTAILADLRKNKTGVVVTQQHKVPMGDWFEFLSSPHSTAEMLMYLSLEVILWENATWFYIVLWVLSNQIETSLLTHWWYKETFKDFPEHRKALIPFTY